jgi:tryptophanyl-tRNA synthetase
VLTGITTTGSPHLGNYVGAIRPALAMAEAAEVDAYFFLADYHALVKCGQPQRVQRSTFEIAATWLALGLDPARVHFYRQSDIPEIPELTWLLSCVAAKGLLNRAHAYKAATDENLAKALDADAGISMGLFNYPVLMAADILLFNAHQVPVGRDQIQHIEIARDIAQRFNHLYGEGQELFVLPQARIDEQVAVLPGLDGRKMSKSYDNTIPLWLPSAQLRKQINRIVTNLQAPGEPKDPADSAVYTLYQAFATAQQSAAMRQAFAEGIAWGEAKQQLFELIDGHLAAARERYNAYEAQPEKVEQILLVGAERARTQSRAFIRQLRQAVGLRPLVAVAQTPSTAPAKQQLKTPRLARIVEFRDVSGAYQFRLLAAQGAVLLTSVAVSDSAALAELKAELASAQMVANGSETQLFNGDRLLAAGTGSIEAIRQALTELS